jgi:hypothetical protein
MRSWWWRTSCGTHAERVRRSRVVRAIAVRAVDEVGNPTILATLTVVAAILPMAFVGGLMGPYMRPIPVGASAAMLFSLVVAFVVTPWAAVRLLQPPVGHHHEEEDRLTALYRRVMAPLIGSPRLRWAFLGERRRAAAGGRRARPARARHGEDAAVRQQERVPGHREHAGGTALESTAGWPSELATAALAIRRRGRPDLHRHVGSPTTSTASCGTTSCARRRTRRTSRSTCCPAGERSEQSHAIARRMRDRLLPIAAPLGARDPGGGGAAGTARAADARRRDLRARRRRRRSSRAEIRAALERTRRGGRGLVRRAPASAGAPRRGREIAPPRPASPARRHGLRRAAGRRRRTRRAPARPARARGRADRRAAAARRARPRRRRGSCGSAARDRSRARRSHRRARRAAVEPLPQEPAAGDLRHRGRGRRAGEPGLPDPPDERRTRAGACCPRAIPSRSTYRGASRSTAAGTRSSGTASGTSPTRCSATSAWRSPPCWCSSTCSSSAGSSRS